MNLLNSKCCSYSIQSGIPLLILLLFNFWQLDAQQSKKIPISENIHAVSNIDSLQYISGKVGDVITVLGYKNKDDGGGGQFYFKTDTSNVRVVSNDFYRKSSNGFWIRKILENQLNIKWFGVQGDSLTNDSANFQKAIIAASKSKMNLLIPKGIYKIANIELYTNLNINGYNKDSCKLILKSDKETNASCLLLKGNLQNISISNISLFSDGFSSNKNNRFCIYTQLQNSDTIKKISISNCGFYNSKDYGAIFLIGGYQNIHDIKIANCLFSHLGASAITLRGVDNLIFEDNIIQNWNQQAVVPENEEMMKKYHLSPNEFAAFAMQSIPCSNLVVINNKFNNSTAKHFAIECEGTYTLRSAFKYNLFYGNGLDASGISGFYQNCLFEHNRHLDGGGSHRSGYEIVGENDTIINNYVEFGEISLGTGAISTFSSLGSKYLVMYDTVIGGTIVNNSCLQIGGTDTVTDCIIEKNLLDNRLGSGNSPVIDLGGRGVSRSIQIEENKIIANNICVRMFVRDKEGICSNITFENNEFEGNTIFYIDHPDKWMNIVVRKNVFKLKPNGLVNNLTAANNKQFLFESNRINN
jgi:hypothetical protein